MAGFLLCVCVCVWPDGRSTRPGDGRRVVEEDSIRSCDPGANIQIACGDGSTRKQDNEEKLHNRIRARIGRHEQRNGLYGDNVLTDLMVWNIKW